VLKGYHNIITPNIITGVGLNLNGIISINNNSIVTNSDIGTGYAALACTTTYASCCTGFGNPETQWYFPNGSRVPNNPALPYQRTRGQNLGRVILHRNSESTTTGIFHCDIPDASGVTQSLYVGIYDSGTGESCTLSSITCYLQGQVEGILSDGCSNNLHIWPFYIEFTTPVMRGLTQGLLRA